MTVKKRALVTIVSIAVFAVLLFGITPVIAQTPPAAPATQTADPCSFTSASGIGFEFTGENCSALLANYMVALNTFFYRLAIVLAVLMITIGGFQWLIAMGNASKISAAKETIEQAVIGLALAFTAYLIFSQIDQSFVNLKSLDLGAINITAKCEKVTDRLSCENTELTKPNVCSWQCGDQAEQSKPVMPPGEKPSEKWRDPGCAGKCSSGGSLTTCDNTIAQKEATINHVPYPAHNSVTLNNLIQCVKDNLSSQGSALLSSEMYTIETGIPPPGNPICNYIRGSAFSNPCGGACAHATGSCHYGGTTGSNGAEAVDFNAIQQDKENELYKELLKLYRNGNPCKFKFIQFECTHTHISTEDCDSDGIGENIKC